MGAQLLSSDMSCAAFACEQEAETHKHNPGTRNPGTRNPGARIGVLEGGCKGEGLYHSGDGGRLARPLGLSDTAP